MSDLDPFTDVVELCGVLQCMGFYVKSLDTNDANISQESGARTVVINCQTSGLHVVLESGNVTCSCPVSQQQTSGFWEVSGVAGGKPHSKESGSTILGSLPKVTRERISKELREIVRTIKEMNESDIGHMEPNKSASIVELGGMNESDMGAKAVETNKSASTLELGTPEKRHLQIKADTPTRYRSLDTLTSDKDKPEPSIPAPRPLQKQFVKVLDNDVSRSNQDNFQALSHRQSTYTVSSTPGSSRRRNKTSSPIRSTPDALLQGLLAAEKLSEDLRQKLSDIIRDYMDEGADESSMSSLALDVSKISVLKGQETKNQFASSPNLTGLANREALTKSRLRRFESASTSNLTSKPTPDKDGKTSRLPRLSPNIFKRNKDGNTGTPLDGKPSRLQSLFKGKTPQPRISKQQSISATASPNLSGTKKKYSHIKSTIPKPMKKE